MAMTAIVDDVVSGSAVQNFQSSTFTALTEGVLYKVEAGFINNNASSQYAQLTINGETYTTGNWDAAEIRSNNARSTINHAGEAKATSASGNGAVLTGYLMVIDGRPIYCTQTVSHGATNTTGTTVIQAGHHTTETDITQIGLCSQNAGVIEVGSYLKLWSLGDLTKVVNEVAATAVTTLDSGTITALDSSKAYVMFLSVIRATSGANETQVRINGDSTTGNYRRGYLNGGTSLAQSDDSYLLAMAPAGAINRAGFIIANVGSFNSTAFTAGSRWYEGSGQVIGKLPCYHNTETEITQIQATCIDSGGIATDSALIVYEFEP